jgi:phosphoserine phosphatase RsbU/P
LIATARRNSRFLPGLDLFPLLIAAGTFLWLALTAPVLRAQTFDASTLRVPADLDSPWLIHAGDDPAYARPDFDDSQWMQFDPNRNIKNVFPTNPPEIIWYRLHVKVSPDEAGLALREHSISRAFEIYVNGERLMASGQIAPFVPYTSGARLVARIPDRLLSGGSVLVALRVHISPVEWGSGEDPGYFASNLTIGQEKAFDLEDWLAVIGENFVDWLDRVLSVGLGVVALVLFAAQRRNTEYLWLAAAGLISLAELPQPVVSAFSNIPLHWQVITVLFRLATPYVLGAVVFTFVHQRITWRWRIYFIIAGIMNTFSGLQGILVISPAPIQVFANLPLAILFSVIMPTVLAIHWRRGNREAGILLIPIVLLSLYVYAEIGFGTLFQIPAWRDFALRGLNLIDRFPAGPFAISLNNVSRILSTLAFTIIMLRRSTRISRRQAILEGELAAAQEVQQVLVPEQVEAITGFDVESVYEPAQQVGGDFFQVLPVENDGLLVVVGDVAGKGLPAAMLVSVLVGAIRGVAEFTVDPAKLLESLNERLIGRTHGGFSTALAAHITEDGWVTIANAGHLSPYLDGRELELPGALPLGVISGNTYETKQFYLAHGSRLTFYSDGVVEAQNAQGELFGFERARAISTQPAAEIAAAAKQFGQEDDITVVAVARHFAMATAA